MKIIHNENTENHLSIFKQQIKKSKKVFIAVAFFKKSGLDLIINEIKEALKRETIITIVCGLDFYQTEPEALKTIFSLSNQYSNCKLLIHNHKKSITFHPKLFSFTNNTETHLIIGSANFTKGGFENNFELSFHSTFLNDTEQYLELNSIINFILKKAKEINEIEISQYTRKYKIYKQNFKKAQKQAEKEKKAVFDLKMDLVDKFLKEYKSDNSEQTNYKLRKINYIKAKEILEIIRNKELTNEQFYNYYEQLVGKKGVKSLWHSGYLYRGKTKAKNDYLKFKTLLNKAYNNLDNNSEIIIKKLAEFYKKGNRNKIGSFGINKVTEILNTYKTSKFAVVNKNPLSSLKFFGFEKFPNPDNFKPENYRDFNIILSGLMNYCKFETLGQVDHFLNFIYWQVKDKK